MNVPLEAHMLINITQVILIGLVVEVGWSHIGKKHDVTKLFVCNDLERENLKKLIKT